MSVDANALERETLERKDREELQKIVGALGGKATSRTRKADLIDQILELTGVTSGGADDEGSSGGKGSDSGSEGKDSAAEDSGKDDKDSAKDGKGSAAKESGKDDKESGKDDKGSAAKGSGKDDKGSEGKGSADKGSARDAGSKGSKGSDRSGDRSGGGQAGGQGKDDDGDGDGEGEGGGRRRRRRGRNRDGGVQEEYSGDPIPVQGVLDLRDDGYGFLRVDGLLPSKDDCYVSVKQVRQFGLRKGDLLAGGSRPALRNEKNPAIMRIDSVNDVELEPGAERPRFEELTPVWPSQRLDVVLDDADDALTTRALDLLAPIGKGSRVLVLAPPRTGRTALLQTLARAIEANEPDVALSVVLIDERPEELAEMRRLVSAGDVHGTAFDASSDDHVATVELALARARRRAEAGDDVVVIVDGLTRLARAQHAAHQGVGRSLGGLDVAAIETAKRAIGTGRALEEGGSVTIVATAHVDTGSAEDEAVVDAVLGAANVHIRLDRFAAERRVFPALDVAATGSTRPEPLLDDAGVAGRTVLRRLLLELPTEAVADQAGPLDRLLRRIRDTGSNDEVLAAAVEESSD